MYKRNQVSKRTLGWTWTKGRRGDDEKKKMQVRKDQAIFGKEQDLNGREKKT